MVNKRLDEMRRNGMFTLGLGLIMIPFTWAVLMLLIIFGNWVYVLMAMSWVGFRIIEKLNNGWLE